MPPELAHPCPVLPDIMAERSKLKGVIFDNGGTLTSMDKLRVGAIQHACREVGVPVPEDEVLLLMAKLPTPRSYALYGAHAEKLGLPEFTPEMWNKLTELDRDFQLKGINEFTIEPMPLAELVLQQIEDFDMEIGVCTTQPKLVSLLTLEAAHLSSYIKVNISGDDVKAKKPEPDGVRVALELMKIDPEEAVLVGDSMDDVIAGAKAGIKRLILVSDAGVDAEVQFQDGVAVATVSNLLEALYVIHAWREQSDETQPEIRALSLVPSQN